jgi:hypothetical protein
MFVETDWPLYLQFFKILSGFSIGKARSGSGLLFVYLFGAIIFPSGVAQDVSGVAR